MVLTNERGIKPKIFQSFTKNKYVIEYIYLNKTLDFILVNYFDKDAFDFDSDLLNKLAPEKIDLLRSIRVTLWPAWYSPNAR